MKRERRWTIPEPSEQAADLAAALRTSPLIAQMLINRGFSSADDCRTFLSPALTHLHPPESMPNLARAADRIVRAVRDREKIVIYGDYDADGITATAILWHAIRRLGGDADFYIPHRIEEGYGLNAEALRQICDDGARLIISVDCGVTAIDEVHSACERGVDVIITDHHEWKCDDAGLARLPDCFAVVHPRLPAADGAPPYANPNLCGAGVAFKLAWAIGCAHASAPKVSEDFKWFLVEATALAALGTIADVVPLKGENRTLAHFGLGNLKRSKLTGVQALIESAGLTGHKLDSYDVGFKLAPRLNASGRMGHARAAVELLTRAAGPRAAEIVKELSQQNASRQAEEKRIFDQAMAQAESEGYDRDDNKRGVVLGAEGWHSGVIGIVASRVVSRLNKPVVIVSLANGHGQGSARSIPGFHLARALDACRAHLQSCGGHEMAAGLRLDSSKFPDFRAAFNDYARQQVTDDMLVPRLRLDCTAALRQITGALVTEMQRLGPFGMDNAKPLLCCASVEIAGLPRTVGNGAHVQFQVKQDNLHIRCIAFNQPDLAARLRPGMHVDLAAEPMVNEYQGRQSIELEVKDVRASA